MVERLWKKAFDPRVDVENPGEVKSGLTQKQREWARAAYDHKCHMPLWRKDTWIYCTSSKEIQIHHILPQGYAKRVMSTDPDTPFNLIALCKHHHVYFQGQGPLEWRERLIEGVHLDMEWARRKYREDQQAYGRVFAARREQTTRGEIYWNTDFDEHFLLIAEDVIGNYLRDHPWPSKKRR